MSLDSSMLDGNGQVLFSPCRNSVSSSVIWVADTTHGVELLRGGHEIILVESLAQGLECHNHSVNVSVTITISMADSCMAACIIRP